MATDPRSLAYPAPLSVRLSERMAPPSRRTTITVGFLVLAAVMSWGGMLLVVLGRVVPGWALGGVLLVALPVLLRWNTRRHRADLRLELGRRRGVPGFVSFLLVLAAVTGTVLGALGDLFTRYHVLEPRGPGGCTAVVAESSFLLGGHGEVYAVGPSGVAWAPSGSWTADDGYKPVAAGTYTLRWGSDWGLLRVGGRETDPVFPGLHDVNCG